MNAYKMFKVQNFLVIFLSLGIHPADYRGYISENRCVHQG